MATQDETKQCHVCGCLVFLYESGNVAPHYDPHGNKCGANYQLWPERPEAPQSDADCKRCGGTGEVPLIGSQYAPCPVCAGTGDSRNPPKGGSGVPMPVAPQPEAEAPARKPEGDVEPKMRPMTLADARRIVERSEGDAGQRKGDDGLGPSCLEVAETLIDDFIRDVSLLRDRQDRNELVRRVATVLSMQREALKTAHTTAVVKLIAAAEKCVRLTSKFNEATMVPALHMLNDAMDGVKAVQG